jgi:hypothetical protein
MAAFITRTQDSALRRGSRRAALKQWATPPVVPLTGRTNFLANVEDVESDGLDLWVAVNNGVARVRASDGSVVGTWTGATNALGVLVARGRIYVIGITNPGNLYLVDPSMAPRAVTILSSSLGVFPHSIATDGRFIWTANAGLPPPVGGGSISKVDPDNGTTTNITAGFNQPIAIIFDGSNLWVTDVDNTLKKLDASGNVIQSEPTGVGPELPVFDGANIWVPNFLDSSVTVVRARDGLVLATLTGNGLTNPTQAAFDGQRILVTNPNGKSVSLWNATSLTPIGNISTGATGPNVACSDGINFWIALGGNQLARL